MAGALIRPNQTQRGKPSFQSRTRDLSAEAFHGVPESIPESERFRSEPTRAGSRHRTDNPSRRLCGAEMKTIHEPEGVVGWTPHNSRGHITSTASRPEFQTRPSQHAGLPSPFVLSLLPSEFPARCKVDELMITSVRAARPLYPRGQRSGPGYSVPVHQHLFGPIRPTRGHIPISPSGGLYEMPSLCIFADA
jgi:hypothetical protein